MKYFIKLLPLVLLILLSSCCDRCDWPFSECCGYKIIKSTNINIWVDGQEYIVHTFNTPIYLRSLLNNHLNGIAYSKENDYRIVSKEVEHLLTQIQSILYEERKPDAQTEFKLSTGATKRSYHYQTIPVDQESLFHVKQRFMLNGHLVEINYYEFTSQGERIYVPTDFKILLNHLVVIDNYQVFYHDWVVKKGKTTCANPYVKPSWHYLYFIFPLLLDNVVEQNLSETYNVPEGLKLNHCENFDVTEYFPPQSLYFRAQTKLENQMAIISFYEQYVNGRYENHQLRFTYFNQDFVLTFIPIDDEMMWIDIRPD